MIKTLAQIQSLLRGEINANGNREDTRRDVSPFTLLRDVIESIDSIATAALNVRIGEGNIIILGNGNTTVGGFTMLGSAAPKVKMKKLTGTSPAVGASATIAHGLDKSKIIGAEVLVNNNTGNRIPPNFTSVANHEFDFFIDTDNVHIYCIAANSSNIDNNAFTVLITYEE